MDIDLNNDVLRLTIDEHVYSEEVIFKCFYWYTSQYDLTISKLESHHFLVSLKATNIALDEAIIPKIKRDLVDYKLRDVVNRETCTVRELIIAKAFAYYDLQQNPVADVSDPVGFDPTAI